MHSRRRSDDATCSKFNNIMTTEENNRREFEEWARKDHPYMPLAYDINENRYYQKIPQVAWEAWQAAREQSSYKSMKPSDLKRWNRLQAINTPPTNEPNE